MVLDTSEFVSTQTMNGVGRSLRRIIRQKNYEFLVLLDNPARFVLYIMYYILSICKYILYKSFVLASSNNNDRKPRQRQRLYEEVANEIGLRIVSGVYPPNETLPFEEELVAEFGVSRTVIRETIKVLTDKGMVQPRQRIGTVVHPRSNWSLLDSDVLNWELQAGQQEKLLHKVTEARRVIESEAAALAAQRASEEQLHQMEESLSIMEQTARNFTPENARAYVDADMVFHATILNACGNELLEQMANMMRQALVASREITTRMPGNATKAIPAHRLVLEALLNRDSDGAHKAMKALIDRAKSDIEEAFRKHLESTNP